MIELEIKYISDQRTVTINIKDPNIPEIDKVLAALLPIFGRNNAEVVINKNNERAIPVHSPSLKLQVVTEPENEEEDFSILANRKKLIRILMGNGYDVSYDRAVELIDTPNGFIFPWIFTTVSDQGYNHLLRIIRDLEDCNASVNIIEESHD